MSAGGEPPPDPPEPPEGPFGRRTPSRVPAPAPEEAPPRPPRRPPPPVAASVTWILGVALVIALAVITVNTIRTEAPGSRGIKPGRPLPVFAMPLALAPTAEQFDANLRIQRDGDKPAACDVRGPDVLNICELAERGPVVLAFLVTKSDKCLDEIDRLERLRRRFRDVVFAAVAIRGDVADVRRIIRERKWRLPVGYDHDGAVANVYAVAICPTITFARAGGIVASTSLGFAGETEIARRIEAIR